MSADGNDAEEDGSDSGPGRRETAQRLFAAEFEDATFSYAESDEERAPNYVVAPSGARINRLFAVGVLTEVEAVSENVLRGRIVDPTGAFVTYAGQYQPDALAFLERTDPPAFVAVTGKARTFEPEDSDAIYTSVRPETMNEVDAETRDRWVVNAAERTRERVETLRGAKARAESGDDLESSLRAEGVPEALAAGAPRALEAYGTTDDYLDALSALARDAVGVVAGQREEAGSLDIAPGEGEDREAEPVTRVEEEADERESREPDPVGTGESAGQPSAPEPAEEPGETVETEAADTGEFDEPAAENVEEEPDDSEFTPNTESPEAATEPMGEDGPEPTTRVEEEADERESKLGDPVGTEETAGQPSAPEPAEEPGETAETEAAETGEFDEPAAENVEGGSEEPTETDEMYEFDEEERQQVEEEHGLEFSTGGEVEPAEELGDEPATEDAEASDDEPDSGDASEEGGLGDFQSGLSDDSGEAADADGEAGDEPTDSEDDADVDFDDLEEAAVEAMAALGGGGAVERDALVEEIVSRYGVSEAEADDAIEEALMSGRCYESGDGELTPI